ncbi:MAG: transposase [Candidatus Omnitrophica bacterium]|nr:transposase [Candidatus Omnitrophota bacterium]
MARPLRIEYPHAFYHVIQRGIERKSIFVSDRDKEKFLSYIESANKSHAALVHTYVLMNNHYHLILETPRANLVKIMHYINASYAIYFNVKRKRMGPLYQGRYKAILVQEEEYLHHLSRYIHLNPVRAKIVKDPIDYKWSSYKYFVSNALPPKWLVTEPILSTFNANPGKAKALYRDFVIFGIEEEKYNFLDNLREGYVLGNSDFFENIKRKVSYRKDEPEIPVMRKIKQRGQPSLGNILDIVKNMAAENARLERKLVIYLAKTYTDNSLRNIASFYGNLKYKTVSKICERIKKLRQKDKKFDALLNQMEKAIEMSNVET